MFLSMTIGAEQNALDYLSFDLFKIKSELGHHLRYAHVFLVGVFVVEVKAGRVMLRTTGTTVV